MTQTLSKLALLSGLAALALSLLGHFGLLGKHPGFAWLCWGFLVAVTALVLALASLSKKVSTPRKAANVILGSMALKFILSLLLIVAYAMAAKPDSQLFVIPFFILYAIFAVFETRQLVLMGSGRKTGKQ